MALEGTIKEFGVTDILQLMAQQQKTGILVVENKKNSAEIYFIKGEIVATHSSSQTASMGEMLVKGNIISEENLKRALEKQKDTFDFLGNIFLKEGLITKEQLQQIVLTQVYETFYDILQWREGNYRFVAESVRIDSSIVDIPGLESILLDVLRMIDEWPEIKQVIRSLDLVFAKVEGRTAEELDEDELPVYRLIDGKNTVRDIIAGSLMGRFAASKILVDLLQDGFIELIAEKAPKEVKKKKENAVQRYIGALSYAGLAVALTVLALLSPGLPRSILPVLSQEVYRTSLFNINARNRLLRRVETALEMYRFDQGRYPDALYDLVVDGMLTADDARECARRSIRYSRDSMTYRLGTPNPRQASETDM